MVIVGLICNRHFFTETPTAVRANPLPPSLPLFVKGSEIFFRGNARFWDSDNNDFTEVRLDLSDECQRGTVYKVRNLSQTLSFSAPTLTADNSGHFWHPGYQATIKQMGGR